MKRRTITPYLRALRKRSALSQDDIAFLLGTFTGSRVSRHETGACAPPIEVALAYEVIFGAGIAEIYEDEVLEIATLIGKRARTLRESLAHRLNDPHRAEKRSALEQIVKRCNPDEPT